MNTRKCAICKRPNDTVYWHVDPDTNALWCYCNSCNRGYSIEQYCHIAGISLAEYLKGDFNITSTAINNELNAMEWPKKFVSLSDPRAAPGREYLLSRGLTLDAHWYYDVDFNGIVFPLYYDKIFCGAQTRLIEPWIDKDGGKVKITTIPGTRVGLLIWSFNQVDIMSNIKAFVVCEGAINAASLQQSLNQLYGSAVQNPFKVVAISGSGAGEHIQDVFRELKEKGYKVICATDNDEAGLKAFKKLHDAGCLTHYAFTDDRADWNDELQKLGHAGLSKYFLARVKPIV
jgi:5S rRNA maturation endonuclease (ribonuclease M5)